MGPSLRLHLVSFAVALLVGLACESRQRGCPGCDPDTEYCVEYGSDLAGVPSTFGCVPLPAACEDDPSCDCLAMVDDAESGLEWSLSFCLEEGLCEDDDGAMQVVCPGG